MALKGDRYIVTGRPDFFLDEVAERGGILVVSTVGSGAALDQAQQLSTYAANSSGKVPLGVLMGDMVNIDLTKYKLNQHRDESQKGGKVWIADRGWVRTNMVIGSPGAGVNAYLSSSGFVTSTLDTNGGTAATPLVGRFMSRADEDGYIKLEVNLP